MLKNKSLIFRIIIIVISIFLFLNLVLQLILSLSNSGLNLLDIYVQRLPKKDQIAVKYPDELLIKKESYFEEQGLNQCAGFSSAYLLRHLNHDISGSEVYEKLDYKFSNGYVLPQAIIKVLNDYDLKANLYQGNIGQLKTHLNNKKPIIVLIGDSYHWQHYVSVVGYDKDNIYLYDSLYEDSPKSYNRVMDNDKFLDYWDNGTILYNNVYYVVE